MKKLFILAAFSLLIFSCGQNNPNNEKSRARLDSGKNDPPNDKIQLKAKPEDSANMANDTAVKFKH